MPTKNGSEYFRGHWNHPFCEDQTIQTYKWYKCMVIFRTFPYNSLILWVDVNKQWPLRYFMHPLRCIAKHLGISVNLDTSHGYCRAYQGKGSSWNPPYSVSALLLGCGIVVGPSWRGFFQMEGQAEKKIGWTKWGSMDNVFWREMYFSCIVLHGNPLDFV